MTCISIQRLLEGLLPQKDLPPCELMVRHVTADSRLVQPGTLFLALPGSSQHGFMFAEQAAQRGAVAIAVDPRGLPSGLPKVEYIPVWMIPGLASHSGLIASRLLGHPSRKLWVAGITGTNGKTSCAHYIAQISPDPIGLIGTIGAGMPDAMTPLSHTTPDTTEIHYWLEHCASQHAKGVVMEVSSHALDQQRTQNVCFDTAILTSIQRDHLDYHGSIERYAATKMKLFQQPGLASAIIPASDPWGPRFNELSTSIPKRIAYATRSEFKPLQACAHLITEITRSDEKGITLSFEGDFGTAQAAVPLFGAFNAINLTTAIATLLARDISLMDILARLPRVRAVRGRMEKLGGAGCPNVVVDFAHTPDALHAALLACRTHLRGGRLWCVFGCGGNRDQGKRSVMGAIAARWSDQIIITDDNPRSEPPDAITAQIAAGLMGSEKPWMIEHDRFQAIGRAISEAGANDVILVAGKGHENIQDYGTEAIPFSDQLTVLSHLKMRDNMAC